MPSRLARFRDWLMSEDELEVEVKAGEDLVVGGSAQYVQLPNQWTSEYTINAAVYANDLVGAATQFWQINLGSLPFVAWDGVANTDGAKPLFDHPFSQAFNPPNTLDSQMEFWAMVIGELDIAEEGAFTVGILNLAGSLADVWPKSGDEVRIKKDPLLGIAGFEVKVGNSWQPAGENRPVAWIRIPGPSAKDRFTSYPPLKVARNAIREDTDMGRWTRFILKNMGRLSALVGIDDPNITKEIAREVESAMNHRLTGSQNAGKIGVVGGKVSVQKLGIPFNELDFDALKDRMELAVARAFGIPAELLQLLVAVKAGDGLAGGTKYRELKRIAWDNRLLHIGDLIANKMGTVYGPIYNLDPQHVGFDYSQVHALKDDVDALFERANAGAAWLTPAEPRIMTGFEESGQTGSDDIQSLLLAQTIAGLKGMESKSVFDKAVRFQWREAKATAAEAEFDDIAQTTFKSEGLRVVEATATASSATVLEAATTAVKTSDWFEAYDDAVLRLVGIGGTQEIAKAGADVGGLAARAQAAAAERALALAGEVTDTTKGQIDALIQDGLAKGQSTDEIAKRLVEDTELGPYYTKTVDQRARTISRTETVGAIERGSLEGAYEAQAQGFVVTKEWITAGDEKVRPLHSASQAQGKIPLEEDFIIGGPAPLQTGIASEDINCRCDAIYNYE